MQMKSCMGYNISLILKQICTVCSVKSHFSNSWNISKQWSYSAVVIVMQADCPESCASSAFSSCFLTFNTKM